MDKNSVRALIRIIKCNKGYANKNSCLHTAWYERGYIYATDRFRAVRIPVDLDLVRGSYVDCQQLAAQVKLTAAGDDYDWSALDWQDDFFIAKTNVSKLFDKKGYGESSDLNGALRFNPEFVIDGMNILMEKKDGIARPVDLYIKDRHSATSPLWMENSDGVVYILNPINIDAKCKEDDR